VGSSPAEAMDSDEEEVSENDVLDWYSGRVEEIWDSATDSAFSELSSNLTDVFRQVMNDVKQRSQTSIPAANGHSPSATNGHSSSTGSNGYSVSNGHSSVSGNEAVANVTVSSEQLMAMLEDDGDWLEDDNSREEEEMVLSVQLTDTTNTNEEAQKNVKGVSQGTKCFLADSILLLCKAAFTIITSLLEYLMFLIIIVLLIYSVSLLHNPLQKWFLRNMQNHIYPSMRLLRLATLPWIQQYPSLSDWHEETCLISNPLYWQRPIDCWSCSQIDSPHEIDRKQPDLDDYFAKNYYHSGVPMIIRGLFERVSLQDVHQLYNMNKWQFLQGIGSFSSLHFFNVTDFFYNLDHFQTDSQASWKITRVGTGRLFRKLFPRPAFIPLETEVALHKYLFVEGAKAPPHEMPMTEFANMWVMQGSGQRTISFEPSVSCRSLCPQLKATIYPGDVLYYNWQFWNPTSLPVSEAEETSVTYVGSFY